MISGGLGGGGGRGGASRGGQLVRRGRGRGGGQLAQGDGGNPLAQLQAFSGGVSKSERILCAGTDGSVAEVEANIEQAVRQFGAAPGAKKMMDGERIAAEEAIQTGLYGVWRNACSGSDFCGRVGPAARCFCGHDYSDHTWGKSRRAMKPSCTKCGCRGFNYICRRPEEVGEYWLPRRRGFDVNIWRAKCKCGHSHEDHDPNTFSCRCCGCSEFQSAWQCIGCEGKWEDHETLFESEEERRLQNRAVGQAFMPLASTPAIQQMVLDDSTRGEGSRSFSLPHRPRPERSVKLMMERCDNYGGRSGFNALPDDPFHGSSLEDAFPSRGGPAASGSLEDAFPPKRGGAYGARSSSSGSPSLDWPARGGLEDAFPPQRQGAVASRSGSSGSAAGGPQVGVTIHQGDMASFSSRGAGHAPPRAPGPPSAVGRPLIRRSGSRPNSGNGSRPNSASGGSPAPASRGSKG